MALVDPHCHLQMDAFDADRDEVIARALGALDWLITIGDTLESSRRGLELAAAHDRVYATVGIHPHHGDDASADALAAIEDLAASPNVVAIGEIGLDYHYNFSKPANQRAALERQLELAIRVGLPVVFHCREAEEDFAAIVAPFADRLNGAVMHCFGGDAAFARQSLDWGFYVSFAGNVTFPKAEPLRAAARVVPLERLMVETDSPYLAPQPVRGRRCEPLFVTHTAQFLANVKGVSLEELSAATTANAARLFRISRPMGPETTLSCPA
jgi:TatD DNase family protein